MTYTRTVVFTRESSDDLPVAEANGFKGTDDEKLTQQLVHELQAAYDDGNMAGSFEVKA